MQFPFKKEIMCLMYCMFPLTYTHTYIHGHTLGGGDNEFFIWRVLKRQLPPLSLGQKLQANLLLSWVPPWRTVAKQPLPKGLAKKISGNCDIPHPPHGWGLDIHIALTGAVIRYCSFVPECPVSSVKRSWSCDCASLFAASGSAASSSTHLWKHQQVTQLWRLD